MSVLEIVGYVTVLIFSTVGFLVVLCLAWVGINHLAKQTEDRLKKVPIETEPNKEETQFDRFGNRVDSQQGSTGQAE